MSKNSAEKQKSAAKTEFRQEKDEKRRKNDAADADAGSGDANRQGKTTVEVTEVEVKVVRGRYSQRHFTTRLLVAKSLRQLHPVAEACATDMHLYVILLINKITHAEK